MATSIFDVFGVTALYDPIFDEVVECTVILEHDSVLQPSGLDTDVVEIGITIDAKYADIGMPERGHTFKIDETTYTVQRIESNDHLIVRMWVTENEM